MGRRLTNSVNEDHDYGITRTCDMFILAERHQPRQSQCMYDRSPNSVFTCNHNEQFVLRSGHALITRIFGLSISRKDDHMAQPST